jgi:cell shape-determining protein MreC
LSNLTKVLIVLLTISTIFLCGIVVTYVANADNFKQRYNKLTSDRDALNEKVESLTAQLNEKIQQKDDLEKSLNNQTAALKVKADELQTKLNTMERENKELVDKANTFASVTKAFTETNEKQTQTLNAALEDVKQLKADQIKLSKELDEASSALMEKNAIIESLEIEKRRLTEEKADVQTRLDRMLQAGGRMAAASEPVTRERGPALAAQPATQPVALKGRVVEVDARNSLATLSIGSADGVKEGMNFHVTRGDDFICDIRIIDVDTDKAVGTLELIQQQPKIGDNASTKL